MTGDSDQAPAEDTQDEPVLAMHDPSQSDRWDGLVAQLRADVLGQNTAVVDKAVRGRIAETGVVVEEEVVVALIAELAAEDQAG
mgnify:CR=1 FL=1